MSTSPTPSEREASDKAAKAKETEEQASLPYQWSQTIQDLDISIPIPANLKARDLDIKLGRTSLKIAIKGQSPLIDVSNHHHTQSPPH